MIKVHSPRGASAEAGESLVELLVTMAIIGIGIIALLTGLLTAINASGTHREQADAGAVARNVAESIKDNTVNLDPDPPTDGKAYESAWNGVNVDGVDVTVHAQCWNGALDTQDDDWGACPQDTGLQRISIEAKTNDADEADEKVTILKRDTVA